MSQAAEVVAETKPTSPWKEIAQPFVDLVRAPRALWGVNLGYLIEGMCYFGILTYLSFYFSDLVGLDDTRASWMVGTLTWGITLSMVFFGSLADKWGVRIALVGALGLILVGRALLAGGPTLGLAGGGLFTPLNVLALGGILLVVLGYGMYQPAAYAAVKQFTTEKTAAMGFAMLYALMNLGGWLPTFFGPIRQHLGLDGALWVFVAFTAVGLAVTSLLLSKKTVEKAIADAKALREQEKALAGVASAAPAAEPATPERAPGQPFSLKAWWRGHPLSDAKFTYFIFVLVPVQTLFAHNWLTLPKYVARAYGDSWVGQYFEITVNFNPLLIFILVPIVTSLTQRANVYKMMMLGTLVMGAPAFLLSLGTSPWLLFAFILFTSIGEAMWQPRFLQYAAQIAPEGKTGVYMGVAQLPWFLTKMIVPLYAGFFLKRYVPAEGAQSPETMWFLYAWIAVSTPVLLWLARNWLGKDFKTKAA